MEIDKLQLCILAVLEENNATTPGTGMTLREIGTLRNMLSQRGCSFLFKIGNKNMVKRKEFEKYLDTVHFV